MLIPEHRLLILFIFAHVLRFILNAIRIMREKCALILILLNCATLAEVAEPKGMIVSVAKWVLSVCLVIITVFDRLREKMKWKLFLVLFGVAKSGDSLRIVFFLAILR